MKARRRRTFLLSGALLGLLLALCLAGQPEPLPRPSVSARILDSKIYEVAKSDHYLIDHARATQPNGGFSGLAHRELDTRVWYPVVERQAVAPGRHPLLLVNHGYSSTKLGVAYLAEFLASQGYVVVAADFPLSQVGAPGGATASDVLSQPGDISFVIDTLLSWDADPGSPYFGRLDSSRIGVIGLSLGGLTSALLVYHPTLLDSRVRLGVSIAAPLGALSSQWLQGTETPFMVINSAQDALLGHVRHAQLPSSEMPGGTLVTLRDGSHAGFSGFSRYLRWLTNPDWLTCARLRGEIGQDANLAGWLVAPNRGEPQHSAVPAAPLCNGKLEAAMNPVRQHWVTKLAVYNFVQQQFAQTGTEKARALHYLAETLPRELDVAVAMDVGGRIQEALSTHRTAMLR